MGRLAPRLLFFQYSNIVTAELDEKNKKYRFYQIRTAAEMEILRLKTKKHLVEDVGLSMVKESSGENRTEASIFDVHDVNDFSDTATVFSTYDEDDR